MWRIISARSPGFLSKGQAKEIFLLKDKDFEELPQCGRLQTEFGWSTPKHIRDCAAAALARLGSFKELTEVSPQCWRRLTSDPLHMIRCLTKPLVMLSCCFG